MLKVRSFEEQQAKDFADAVKGHLCSACQRRTTEWSKRPCCFVTPGGKYCPPIAVQKTSPCQHFTAKPNPHTKR